MCYAAIKGVENLFLDSFMISNAVVEAKYESSPSVLPNGGTKQIGCDSTGALRVNTPGGGSGGSTAPTTSTIVGAVYNATPPTYTDGQQTQNQADASGSLKTTMATLISGENQSINRMMVVNYCTGTYISTATTTTIKSGSGVLHAITITESVASTIIVYDNTAGSGTIIASFPASATAQTYQINVSFSIGCTVVTAGASKLTVSTI